MILSKSGDTVQVHYTGRLTDGTVFDSSAGREPLEFELGAGMVIKGFDDGLLGMAVGSQKTINIPNIEAYGPVFEEQIFEMPKTELPNDMPFEVGMQLNMHEDGSGQVVPVTIVEVTENTVVFDANHPLAGKDLIFDVEMVSIN